MPQQLDPTIDLALTHWLAADTEIAATETSGQQGSYARAIAKSLQGILAIMLKQNGVSLP